MNKTAIKLRDLILASEERTLEDELGEGCKIRYRCNGDVDYFYGGDYQGWKKAKKGYSNKVVEVTDEDREWKTIKWEDELYPICKLKDGRWVNEERYSSASWKAFKYIDFEILGKPITLNRLLLAMWKKCSFIIAIDLQGRFLDYDFKLCSECSIDLTHTNILDNDEPTLAKLVDLLTKK